MATTLQRVSLLFERLTQGSNHPLAWAYHQKWTRWIDNNSVKIETTYADDGDPVTFATETPTGVNVCCMRWTPPNTTVTTHGSWPHEKPSLASRRILASSNWHPVDWTKVRGSVFFIHGVTDHSRFTLLRLKSLHDGVDTGYRKELSKDQMATLMSLAKRGNCEEEVEGSWLQKLLEAGFVTYAVDLQGHGLSGAWEGSRCNVERFSEFITDVINWMSSFLAYGEWQKSVPLFLSGLSMGGCIATRVVQVGYAEKRLGVHGDDLELEPTVPILRGTILFCPALSAERLKKKPINRIALPAGKWLSEYQPMLKLAALEKNKPFPYISEVIKADPLVYTASMPVRLSYEVLLEIDKIWPNIDHFPEKMPMVIIQSRDDTMTDPEGSQKFVDRVACKDKSAIFLDFAWHFLSKEPGSLYIIEEAIRWMHKRV